MEELLQWVFLSGTDTAVTQTEDGEITADRPETEEKFRVLFQETGLRSFFGVLLKDEEGKLGVLGFESKEPLIFDEETRDLLSILVNQATVAVRNAQLYQQVPLAGFLKPLLEKRRKLRLIPKSRRRAWTIGAIVAALVLFVVPWPLRIAGPARVLPGKRAAVTSLVDGVVSTVLHREGDRVEAGAVIATLKTEPYEAALARARSELALAETDIARSRQEADAAAVFDGESRKREAFAAIALAEDSLARTRLTAPAAGVIVTPRIEERVGQLLTRGAELCVVADLQSVIAEVAVPESEVALVKAGQKTALKFNPYPGRLFRGTVERVAARLRQEGEERFLIVEVAIPNADAQLKTGHARHGQGLGRHAAGLHGVLPPARALPLEQDLAPVAVSPATRPDKLIAAAGLHEGAAALAARHGAAGDRPALRKDLVVRRIVRMGEVKWVAKDPVVTAYYNFDDAQWGLIQLFDGTRTVEEIHRDYQAMFPREPIERALILEHEEILRKIDFIEKSAAERNLQLLAHSRSARQRAAEEKAEGFNPFFMLFHVLDPDRFLDTTLKYVRWLWTPPVVAGAMRVLRVDDRRHRRALERSLERHQGALRPGRKALSRNRPVHSHHHLPRRDPRVRPRLRDDPLRRRGPRHRHRPRLLRRPPSTATRPTRSSSRTGGTSSGSRTAGIYIEAWICSLATVCWIVSYPDTFLHEFAFKTMLYTGVSTHLLEHQPAHQDRRVLRADDPGGDLRAARGVLSLHRRLLPEAPAATSGRGPRASRAASGGSTGSTARSRWPGSWSSCGSSAASSTTSTTTTSPTGRSSFCS